MPDPTPSKPLPANTTVQKKPGPPPLGRIFLFGYFLIFLVGWLRSDFHSSTTYALYYAIPFYIALRYITHAWPFE